MRWLNTNTHIRYIYTCIWKWPLLYMCDKTVFLETNICILCWNFGCISETNPCSWNENILWINLIIFLFPWNIEIEVASWTYINTCLVTSIMYFITNLHTHLGMSLQYRVVRSNTALSCFTQVESTQRMIRIVGLSATLPNYLEVACSYCC